ncbi:hypothetical protein SAMN05444274_105124 [Mariniphaga anaerophila]|uniref:MEMO1 family protein SAMN05444274_105124 n=1 Tax=Mariniphaga anaerophila TaxID=1484053 RepID=A0A1M5BFM6_9BACT|nr:AmmeMemoRadiSam system protein B [Mariniphaga anaerophila]SHF41215.1 hypothetical protein SAMN05444274_105124 [Mariniphaga anaerophila]
MKNSGEEKRQNREPRFAGKFYPGTKAALFKQLSELFLQAGSDSGRENTRAVIVPHAGYIFSGEVVAAAYARISSPASFKRVFVLASSHQFLFGGAAVFDSGNYETPLGEITVDKEVARMLLESGDVFCRNPEAHEQEHSLEVQLPFLQYLFGDGLKLVPIVLGTNNISDCEKIAKALATWFCSENLFVVSTDFSHYPQYNDAVENDLRTAEAICSNNPLKLLEVLDENRRKEIGHLATSLCGWTSVLTLMYLTRNEKVRYQKIAYRNSGDAEMYGDKDRVVGYWSIGVCDEKGSFNISKEDQKELLEKARNAIFRFVKTGRREVLELSGVNGALAQQAGVFVSVYIRNELRGCIGSFAKNEILNDLVQRMAVSAACDFRFEQIEADEINDMELEISVLSTLKKIESIDEIELGKHGILIKHGIQSGTFLPQVAQKTGWTLDEFLGHCSRDKAGLGWSGWKKADVFIYEAFVFRG